MRTLSGEDEDDLDESFLNGLSRSLEDFRRLGKSGEAFTLSTEDELEEARIEGVALYCSRSDNPDGTYCE